MEVVVVEKEMESIVLPYRDHLSLITFWIFSATYVWCCFSLRTVVFRCGPLRSAGTAPASSRSPLCGVFRHVLFPQESTVLRSKHHVSEGNTRRLQRESEDDETPQRALFASEEAHREPAESVVDFRSGILHCSL